MIPHPDHIARCPFCGGWPAFRHITTEEFNSGIISHLSRYCMECSNCHSIRYVLNTDTKRFGINEETMLHGDKNERDLAVEVWNDRRKVQ